MPRKSAPAVSSSTTISQRFVPEAVKYDVVDGVGKLMKLVK